MSRPENSFPDSVDGHLTGMNPYRFSQLDPDVWVNSAGSPRLPITQMLEEGVKNVFEMQNTLAQFRVFLTDDYDKSVKLHLGRVNDGEETIEHKPPS
mmetsp:Transcript_40962/g.103200  ORF Transcript_40962/g.103200 Transcript_40962/m.103200 type:complete len:97 (+) Transcript_40962:870-1160(+)